MANDYSDIGHEDIRAAFLKSRHGHVDTDAAWAEFESSLPGKPSAKDGKGARIKWISMGALIGVAASLACFLLMKPLFTESREVLLVSEAIQQQDSRVRMESSTSSEHVVSTQIAQAMKHEEGIFDFRKIESTPGDKRTVVTPRGKVQTVILSDGTKVLLNNESKLSFPARFEGDTRTVLLEGEAYFTVAPDKAHPFIVRSGNMATTALGTRFNVKAYKEKSVHVTLVDGSVKVTDGTNEIILKPGEDVCCINDKLVIADADTKTYKQWEDGFFYYDNVPLIDVLLELGRWYNMNIQLENRRLMSYRLHFIADREASIDDALERLNEFSYLEASRNGNTVIVKEKDSI